ncbi:hypothetical protein KVU04_003286 [Salmonella enterica subsp. enterica serovar Typhimurium]|nr:hypothetical protein [Salmonella enterica subsp. enterica serovar Typhimurium]EHS1470364.1 hypothetical protein [Salmonella enterica subsp. enterica serovar Typhimurium]
MMKLIDVLVRDLEKFDGWPEGAVECHRFADEAVVDFFDKDGNWPYDCTAKYGLIAIECVSPRVMGEGIAIETVTRDQYEAALAASKTEWDGAGHPPAGCKFEYKASSGKWFTATMKYCGESFAIVDMDGSESWVTLDAPMRPIRSEEDKKLDQITQSILDILNDYDFEMVHIRSDQKRIATDIVERITSGMIPHIRIE